jgi:hypothetical protein
LKTRKNGQKDGKGEFHYVGGIKYVGEWKNDKKCGAGTIYYKNGAIFAGRAVLKAGNFLEGKKHGEGIFTNPQGEQILQQRWRMDQLISAKPITAQELAQVGIELIADQIGGTGQARTVFWIGQFFEFEEQRSAACRT